MYKKFFSTGLMTLALLGITACVSTEKDSTADIITNTYTISFYFEDNLYKSFELSKGEYLTEVPEVPVKEGYTVTWPITDFSNIQSDTAVSAVLTQNTYAISFYVDDVLLETKSFKYGETISAPEVLVSDGKVFGGFSGLPETMTAGNLNVYGYTFDVDDVVDVSTFEDGYILSITSGGTYYFTGAALNVGININTKDDVNIYLSDLEVSNLKQAFIYVEKANSVNIITSSNVILSDNASNVDKVIISSNSPLVLNGSGSLELTSLSGLGIIANKTTIDIKSGSYLVNANDNGIQAKGKGSSITITGGSLDITSTATSIKSKGDITIDNASITVNSSEDGIQTDGSVVISSGCFNITSLTDSIQGDTAITIQGGNFTLESGGGVSKNASLTTSSDFIFEEEDTTSFTEESEYYGLYVLVNGTYIEIDEDNYSDYKAYKTFYDKKSARGLKSDGTILVSGGSLDINSLDDGIKTDTTFNQTGGSITINSKSDGIQGDESIEIDGGVITINTTGSFYQSSSGSYKKNGTSYYKTSSDSFSSGSFYDLYTSTKGLKSDSLIYVTNGSLTITSDDDSIHSDEYVTIVGGTLNLTSLDDGIHADSVLAVGKKSDNGTITLNVLSSYEGLEGASIYVYYGNISVVSTDDGMNAAGGSDSTTNSDSFKPGGNQGGWHRNSASASSTNSYNIFIYGGTIVINASGDGIDSNGSIYIYDGDILVFGPSDNGNAAIDYGDSSSDKFEITGGSIVAIGTSGMVVYPTSGVYVAFNTSIKANTEVDIVDSAGNVLYSFTTKKACNSIVVSLSLMSSGASYKLESGGTTLQTKTALNK